MPYWKSRDATSPGSVHKMLRPPVTVVFGGGGSSDIANARTIPMISTRCRYPTSVHIIPFLETLAERNGHCRGCAITRSFVGVAETDSEKQGEHAFRGAVGLPIEELVILHHCPQG